MLVTTILRSGQESHMNHKWTAGRVEIWRGGVRFSRNCFRLFRFTATVCAFPSAHSRPVDPKRKGGALFKKSGWSYVSTHLPY
jgi:hypothetical protein